MIDEMDDPPVQAKLPPIELAAAAFVRKKKLPPIEQAAASFTAQKDTGNIDLSKMSETGTLDPTARPKEAPYFTGKMGSAIAGAGEMFPFVNKAVAGLMAIPGEGKYGDRFTTQLHKLKDEEQQSKAENLKSYLAGGLAGAVASSTLLPEVKGIGLASRLARSAAGQGVAYGALQGVSDAEGGIGDYAGTIAKDAAFAGLAAPVVGGLARPFIKKGAQAVEYGASKLGLGNAASAAADVVTATGKNRRALSDLTRQTNQSGKTLEGLLSEANSQTIPGAKGRDLIASAARDLQESGKQFPAAYKAASEITDPELDRFLAEGEGQKLWQAAQADAKKYGRELPTKPGGVSDELMGMAQKAEQITPGSGEKFLAQFTDTGFGKKEVPIPDPEALHFMRKAAQRDPKLGEAFASIKDAVSQHTPDLDAAIEDYAQKARAYDVLKAGKKAPEFYSASTKKAPNFSTVAGDPLRLKEAYTGPQGLEQAVKTLSPEERQAFRTTAQDRTGELLQGGKSVGDAANNEPWQHAVFGSPEAYKAFEMGQTAALPQEKGGIKQYLSGWLPHSTQGAAIKGVQAAAKASQGAERLHSKYPLSIQQVLNQALSRQRGMGTVDALRNALTRMTVR